MCRRMLEGVKSFLATAVVMSCALWPMPVAAGEARVPAAPALLAEPVSCSEKLVAAGFAAAVIETRSPPEFPETDASEESEGWFRIGFTIDAEGETKDVLVLDQVGSPRMARVARLAVARWKYKPATQDGQAVEQYSNAAEIIFRNRNAGNAPIHDAVVAKYDEGRALAGAGKYAEGIAVLKQAFDLPLTLYEQAKVSFALAFAYEKSNDMPRVLEHIRHALIEGGSFLEKALVPTAQRMRLRIEVANGNLRFAACAAPLPVSDNFDPAGADRRETTRIVDDALAKLGSAKPLDIRGNLTAKASGDEGGVWEHPLSRRKFKFAGFIGLVHEFRLSCVRQLMQSPVNETTQWSVPRSAGPCVLRVYGEVGASFKLIEEW